MTGHKIEGGKYGNGGGFHLFALEASNYPLIARAALRRCPERHRAGKMRILLSLVYLFSFRSLQPPPPPAPRPRYTHTLFQIGVKKKAPPCQLSEQHDFRARQDERCHLLNTSKGKTTPAVFLPVCVSSSGGRSWRLGEQEESDPRGLELQLWNNGHNI